MYLIGLTGGISSGKTTVANIFIKEFDVPVIDNDLIARQVVEPGKKAYRKIRHVFPEVFNEDGTIDRKKLGDIIFTDADKRKELNNITHPEIFKEVCWQIVKYFFRGYRFVIIDSPLLYESNVWQKYVHQIIVVNCEEDLQLQRLMERNHLLESEAKARVKSQMPLSEKCARADFVIENSGSIEGTREQVQRVYIELASKNTHWRFRFLIGLGLGGALGLFLLVIHKVMLNHQQDKMLMDIPKTSAEVTPTTQGGFLRNFKINLNPDSLASIF